MHSSSSEPKASTTNSHSLSQSEHGCSRQTSPHSCRPLNCARAIQHLGCHPRSRETITGRHDHVCRPDLDIHMVHLARDQWRVISGQILSVWVPWILMSETLSVDLSQTDPKTSLADWDRVPECADIENLLTLGI